MRPAKQVKVISSQLEILEEIKTELESVLEYTNNVIMKGNSWVKEENDETFLEMNKFLTDETCECLHQCQDITKDKSKEFYQHSDLQERDTSDTRTKSVDSFKSSKPPRFDFLEGNEYKLVLEKCQEMEKTISLHAKKIKKFEQKFQEHKTETKETISKENEEMENQYKIKFDEMMEEFHKASNFMTCLETQKKYLINQIKEHDKQMSSFIETLHSVEEQIKENEQKSETFMKQHKSTENSFSLRLDEVMKDILENAEIINKLKCDSETLSNVVNEHAKNFDTIIPNLQKKLKDLEESFKTINNTCKEIAENYGQKFEDVNNTLKSIDRNKILNVSSQIEKLSKELVLTRQQAYFFAKASGPVNMNVQMDLQRDQIVTNFRNVLSNIGNHYDPTKGIFTAPCDGLYLCSLTLCFEIGDNVRLGMTVKDARGVVSYQGSVQTTTAKSSASVTAPLKLNQHDQVYIAARNAYTQIKIDALSYFMCALITA